MPGVAFGTHRKAILDTFRAGRKEATASSVELAKLWRLVFNAFDDQEDLGESVDLACAHQGRRRWGSKTVQRRVPHQEGQGSQRRRGPPG